MLVLFGSETGTAEELAERVARAAWRCGDATITLKPMNESSLAELQATDLTIFVCSTTGNGEAPRNMQQFWRQLLHKQLDADCLKSMRFAVFGLGDSSYEKFCVVGKRLHRRLLALGANAILDRADGDEQHPFGLDGAFVPWLASLFPDQRRDDIKPKVRLVHESGSMVREHLSPTTASIIENRRVTSLEHWQDVRLISMAIDLQHEPGDVAQLVPENDPQEVDRILSILQWDGEACFSIQEQGRPDFRLPAHLPGIPRVFTLRHLLTHYLDSNTPPGRRFLEVLSLQAFDPAHPLTRQHQERLDELACSSAHYDDYLDYVYRPRRRASEILADFSPALLLPISPDWVFDLFPWIRPRLFSIASHAPGSRLDLLVALVRYRTIFREDRVGLCSQWLARLEAGARLAVSVIPGSLRLPADPEANLLLLCAGTGLAPMRSLLQAIERRGPPSMVTLIFGHRRKQHDFLCWDELQALPWLRVISQGSQDQPQKVYLQHMIAANADHIVDMIASGCFTYVSGNSKLPKAVKGALAEIFNGERGFIDQLEAEGRLQIEAWK